MDNGKVKSYSLPALKELGSVDLAYIADKSMIRNCQITKEGFVAVWTSPTEIALLNVWGMGKKLSDWPTDTLYNPMAPVPPRPTISNLQWISGTQHISAEDFDILIGGPDRPMSRKQIEEERALRAQERAMAVAGGPSSSRPGLSSQQGGSAFSNMTKGIQERTENLTNWSENMQSLENTSQEFVEATQKFIDAQKKKAFLGSLKSFF